MAAMWWHEHIFFQYGLFCRAGCIWNLSLFDHLMHVIYRIVKSLAKQIHAISNSLSWSLSFDCMHFFAAAAFIYCIGRYILIWFFKKWNYHTLLYLSHNSPLLLITYWDGQKFESMVISLFEISCYYIPMH